MSSFHIYKKEKVIFYVFLFIGIFISCNFLTLEKTTDYQAISAYKGKIIEVEKKRYYNKITLKNKNNYVVVYDYHFLKLEAGDIIYVEGRPLIPTERRIDNGFNYQRYLKREKITTIIKSENIRLIDNKFSINIVKCKFLNYIDNTFDDDSKIFLKAMIIGDDSSFSNELKEAVKKNGIMHLFAVSGLHIGLFIAFLYKILKELKVNDLISEVIIIGFLGFYIIITSFGPSIIRASLMYFLTIICRKYRLGFSSLDIISIVFIILICFNPYYMYKLGFQLSFIAAFTIILSSNLFKKYNRYVQIFFISLFCAISTFPIVININNKINILSPITNVLFIEIVSLFILPLSFLVIIFPIFETFYKIVIIVFSNITILISKIFTISFQFPNFSIIMMVIFYILIYLLIKFYFIKRIKYGLIFSFCIYLIIISNITYFYNHGEVDFLDLYYGEAIFIRDRNNECVALIDTGDGRNNEVTNYLKSKGVKYLDYLIITHNHYDHNGEVDKIINEINVNNLVVSAYDNSGYALRANIKVSKGSVIKCGRFNFEILHPDKRYTDENDNSIVIYTRIGHYNFLFLGDATKNVEHQLITMGLDVDIIKVGHHGSSTSSSAEFINSIRPKIAIIQSGRVEKFGFPHSQVISTLIENQVYIYRTDENYSVKYQYTKNKSIFKTIK